MDAEWYEELLRLNSRIIVTEARLAAQVTSLLATTSHGDDATESSERITVIREELFCLRMLRDPMLDKVQRSFWSY